MQEQMVVGKYSGESLEEQILTKYAKSLIVTVMSVEIRHDVSLADLTFYGVGGLAREVWEVDNILEFADIWAETIASQIPKVVLGKGANTIFSDRGFLGRVFILQFQEVHWKNHFVTVEAGKNFPDFIEETNKKGFADFCDLSGIPGTVGGFIRGNAGALGKDISDNCVAVDYVNEYGQVQTLKKEECDFGYRESIFKSNSDTLEEPKAGFTSSIAYSLSVTVKDSISTGPHIPLTPNACILKV